jgi:hypothetical protein
VAGEEERGDRLLLDFGAGVDEVGAERQQGAAWHRHDSILPAFAASDEQQSAREVQVRDVAVHDLGTP